VNHAKWLSARIWDVYFGDQKIGYVERKARRKVEFMPASSVQMSPMSLKKVSPMSLE
jgi:hypothetical protein